MMDQRVPLIRDLLDKLIIDRKGDPMGRVDGIVIVEEAGKQPRVERIEAGIVVLAARLHQKIGRWVRLAAARWGLRRGQPTRISVKKIKEMGIEVKVDVEGDQTPALAWEYFLRERVISKLPRSKS
jgi:hypothetical protein